MLSLLKSWLVINVRLFSSPASEALIMQTKVSFLVELQWEENIVKMDPASIASLTIASTKLSDTNMGKQWFRLLPGASWRPWILCSFKLCVLINSRLWNAQFPRQKEETDGRSSINAVGFSFLFTENLLRCWRCSSRLNISQSQILAVRSQSQSVDNDNVDLDANVDEIFDPTIFIIVNTIIS